MKIKILKTESGLVAGEIRDIPNKYAVPLVVAGIAEEVKSIEVEQKESKLDIQVKEYRFDKKTKAKK